MAHDGQANAAIRNISDAFRLAGHATDEPGLIGYLGACNVQDDCVHALERILDLSGSDPAICAAVPQCISANVRPVSLSAAWRTAVAPHIAMLDMLRKAGPVKGPEGIVAAARIFHSPLPSFPTFRSDKEWQKYIDDNGAVMLRLLRERAETGDRSYPEATAGERATDAELANAYRSGQADRALDDVVSPGHGVSHRRAVLCADAAVAAAAADVLLWKAKHGRFPDRLADAMRTVPTDPFDLKPLGYRKEGDGFVVWSVGKSLSYDGTLLKPKQYESVFRYPDLPDPLSPNTQ